MMLRKLVIAAASLAAGLAVAHEHHAFASGERGDAKRPSRTVEVTATDADGDMVFSPARLDVAKGEQVRFDFRNAGSIEHEFVIGAEAENAARARMMAETPDMKPNDLNAVTIPAGQSASLAWRFSKAGEFEFACLIPGHYELGMHGVVIVK